MTNHFKVWKAALASGHCHGDNNKTETRQEKQRHSAQLNL